MLIPATCARAHAQRVEQVNVEQHEIEVVSARVQVVLGGSPAGLERRDHLEALAERLVELAPARDPGDGMQQQQRRAVARRVEVRGLARRRERECLYFSHQLRTPTGAGVACLLFAIGCGDQWSS